MLRFMAVIPACAVILMSGDTQAQQRTITATGFAINTFDPDWARFVTDVRLEGSTGNARYAQVLGLADSLVNRLNKLVQEQCSTSVGRPSEWMDVQYRDDGSRFKRKGVKVRVDINCSGSDNVRSVLAELSRWSQCHIQGTECGLFNDSVAIRVVSELALADARDQAESSATLLEASLASIVTASVNPMFGMEPSGGCGGYTQPISQFYGRGQLSRPYDQFKVLRRAIAILTYELK